MHSLSSYVNNFSRVLKTSGDDTIMKTFYQYGDPMRLSFSTKNNEQRTGEFYRDSEGLLLKQHELNQ